MRLSRLWDRLRTALSVGVGLAVVLVIALVIAAWVAFEIVLPAFNFVAHERFIFVLALLLALLALIVPFVYNLIVNESYKDFKGVKLPKKRETRLALFVIAIGGVVILALIYTYFIVFILSLLSALWKCYAQRSC